MSRTPFRSRSFDVQKISKILLYKTVHTYDIFFTQINLSNNIYNKYKQP